MDPYEKTDKEENVKKLIQSKAPLHTDTICLNNMPSVSQQSSVNKY